MDTEVSPLVGAPEVAASAPVTPMETSATLESQPSAAILDQSSVSALIPTTLECALHLYYPFDSPEDLTDAEKLSGSGQFRLQLLRRFRFRFGQFHYLIGTDDDCCCFCCCLFVYFL